MSNKTETKQRRGELPARRPRRRKWRAVIVLAAVVLFTILTIGIGFVWINCSMVNSAAPHMTRDPDKIRPVLLGVVPGARIYREGRLSAYLSDRVDGAIKLYRAGKISKILMSGDNSDRYYDEATAMRNYAINHGVPEDDVLRDFAGLRTLDTVWRARDLWQQNAFVIITQAYHQPRALYLARTLGIDAQGYCCDRDNYDPAVAARLKLREYFARAAAWIDINILHTRPRHLGATEPLSGIEQESRIKKTKREIWDEEIRRDPLSKKARNNARRKTTATLQRRAADATRPVSSRAGR